MERKLLREPSMSLLRRYRHSFNPPLAQTTLADDLVLSQGYLSKLELGGKKPSAHVMRRLQNYDPQYFTPEVISNWLNNNACEGADA